MAPVPVTIEAVRIHVLPCRTRLPFRFGIHTLTDVPLCELALDVATPDGLATGHASDLLIPKWFRKRAETPPEVDSAELYDSVDAAVAAATGGAPRPVFEHWFELHQDRVRRDAPDVLVQGFGVGMVERALMDAVCRGAGCGWIEAWRHGLFGFDPTVLHPDLAGWRFCPSQTIGIDLRHTVGLLDAIRRTDVSQRVDDGLPESLEEDIDAGGLRWFKLKIGGDPDEDLSRLMSIVDLVSNTVGPEARFTLDGNEQYQDITALDRLLDHLPPYLKDRLVSIEQPVPRAETDDVDVTALARHAPVIIDEADCDPHAFRRALARGYTGVSVKNCKGVFQAVANHGLCDVLGDGLFQSGEDLTNIASIPLQQDLVTMSALGLSHVERNGHHYFRGLDHLGPERADRLVQACPDLYNANDACAQVAVRDGRLSINSLHACGFGGPVESIASIALTGEHWRQRQGGP